MGSAAHGPRRGERREANDPGPAYGRRGEIRRTPTSGCGWPEASSIHGGGSKATSADAMSAWVGPLRWVRAGGDGGSRIGGCRCWSCGPLWWVVVTGDGGCRAWRKPVPRRWFTSVDCGMGGGGCHIGGCDVCLGGTTSVGPRRWGWRKSNRRMPLLVVRSTLVGCCDR